jgi:hypothetical protein
VTTREQVKLEIDKVEEEYLDVLFRMIRSLETSSASDDAANNWKEFVASTYGCLADAPIERGEQGEFEVRDLLR